MARTPAFTVEALMAAVAATPDGAGSEALQIAFPDVPRRSLQRYLAALTAEGRLRAEGNARARKYYATVADTVDGSRHRGEPAIPLSAAGTQILTALRR